VRSSPIIIYCRLNFLGSVNSPMFGMTKMIFLLGRIYFYSELLLLLSLSYCRNFLTIVENREPFGHSENLCVCFCFKPFFTALAFLWEPNFSFRILPFIYHF
jgi:hypothetical protein